MKTCGPNAIGRWRGGTASLPPWRWSSYWPGWAAGRHGPGGRRQSATAQAGPYLAASGVLTPGTAPGHATDAEAFAKIAAAAPAGYRTLAQLQEAALRWSAGDTGAALALWNQVSANGDDPLLRDMASLLWAQHSVDVGDVTAIAARTAKLETQSNPWRPLALEVDALVALRLEDKDKATRLLRGLVTDPLAADGLRLRASELLVAIGAPAEARG